MVRFAILLLLTVAAPGCVLGSEQAPGCRADHPEDCSAGWSCQAGLCVRPTTGLTEPEAGVDAAADVQSEPLDVSAEPEPADAPEASAEGGEEQAGHDGPVEADDGAIEGAD